jgi:hypothetical protein
LSENLLEKFWLQFQLPPGPTPFLKKKGAPPGALMVYAVEKQLKLQMVLYYQHWQSNILKKGLFL